MSATVLEVPVEQAVAPLQRTVRPRPPAPPRPEAAPAAAVTATALLVLGSLCAWFALHLLVLGGFEQARSQQMLYAQLRVQLADQTAPLGGPIPIGDPVALLTIPTLGLQQVVVEGTASGDLLAGPGHLRSTVLPGQAGVAVLFGRSATYGAPFRAVPSLRAGDGIEVTTGQGRFVYRVDAVRRAGDPLPAPPATRGGRLTLVTTVGHGLTGALAPAEVVYVDATLRGDAAVGEPGRPASVPDAEAPLGIDTAVLPVLAAAMQGLLLAVVGTVLLRRRLPARVLWIVAAPVLVGLAWVTTDALARLLPNLI
ncbi:class E sortase [Cellulomonas sp. ICMP 17802]|uniref:class E sortase n=1 Tax=Cellulomonas sp. ICMP 17802 TaxID=3239199 RepID=UPI00351BB40E